MISFKQNVYAKHCNLYFDWMQIFTLCNVLVTRKKSQLKSSKFLS